MFIKMKRSWYCWALMSLDNYTEPGQEAIQDTT